MHLLVGAAPTVPSPWGDHTNVPNPQTDGYFSDYAPLWKLLRGKSWILEAQAVAASSSTVWTNAFTTEHGAVIVVSFQGLGAHDPQTCAAGRMSSNTNIEGDDLYNVQLPAAGAPSTPKACADLCCQEARCAAWAHEMAGYGVNGNCNASVGACCWLKTSAGTQTPFANVTSGVVNATVLPVPREVDLALNGPTLTGVGEWQRMYPGGGGVPAGVHRPVQGVDGAEAALQNVPLQRGFVLLLEKTGSLFEQ